jgi:hypothetical protein
VDAAAARGIPWARGNDQSLVRLGYGKHLRLIQAAMTDGTSAIGVEVAGDKDLTKARLARASIPVPAGEIVRTEEAAVAAMSTVGAPVVVKPLDGRQGKGVSLDLSTAEEVAAAFRIAQEFSREVLVEEMYEGRNYRVLVVGYRVAAASERIGIYLDGERIVSGDTTGPVSALTILEDKAVEVAVLETARGGIIRRGLGYDWSDIGVMTNVAADHIGQDGIESIEDILWIKSLVAERVREGGTLVLNADDELLASLPEKRAVARVPKRHVYFSLRDDNPVLLEHARAGGTAYFYRGGHIFEVEGGEERAV